IAEEQVHKHRPAWARARTPLNQKHRGRNQGGRKPWYVALTAAVGSRHGGHPSSLVSTPSFNQRTEKAEIRITIAVSLCAGCVCVVDSTAAAAQMRRQRAIVRLPVSAAMRSRAGGGGEAAPRVFPADMTSVKGILREFDRAAYGEKFRGDRLAKIAVLGKGSTSTVWKMVDVDTLRVVAVKEMVVCDSKQSAVLRHELGVLHPQLQPLEPPPKPTPVPLRSAGAVAGTWGGLSVGASRAGRNGGVAAAAPLPTRPGPCPYMPRYFGSFVSQDDGGRPRVSIVLEYVSGVDLARWIEEEGRCAGKEYEVSLPEVWLARVCRDLLGGLQYLHQRGRIHRDVKPANLLLGPDGARLADFGSTISEEEEEGDRMHGTVRFMSPERLCARPYRPSSDLWAAGLTVATAALGENPIPHSANNFEAAEHAEAAFDKVVGHPASAAMSPSLLDFLRVVLVPDPEKRPTVEQMLAHSFV
ncbi:unnamed protein product, partial [Scytosiphon promiscuus]